MWTRLLVLGARLHAEAQRRAFLRDARDAVAVQEGLLRHLLKRHADSAFGREHGFSGIRSAGAFAERVPIRDYEALRPWMDRVYAGETGALFGGGERLRMFALSSGSTDQPKRIPVTGDFLRAYRRGWRVFGISALRDHPEALARCLLQVVSPMEEYRAPCGLPCGAISGLLAAEQGRAVRRFYANPAGTAAIADAEARYYTIMRMAVLRNVAWIVTPNPATTLRLARAAAEHAERLIRDVRDGTLSPPGEPGLRVREELAHRLRPNRALARRMEEGASREGRLLPRHYWRLSFLANWTGGTLGLHVKEFPAWFGAIPVRDIGLLATEGRVSIPLSDGTAAGVVDPRAAFFEFVEEGAAGRDAGAARRMHEVEVGRTYRVVMTNAAGLYRYDLGDFVRVTEFLGACPCVEFLHRGSAVSSLCGEKVTEWQATAAFERVISGLGMKPARFVLAAAWGNPPRYRLYVEGAAGNTALLAARYDEALAELNVEYASKRSSRRLGAVELIALREGVLSLWDEERRKARGRGHEQFKAVHLLSRPGEDGFLCGGIGFRSDSGGVNAFAQPPRSSSDEGSFVDKMA